MWWQWALIIALLASTVVMSTLYGLEKRHDRVERKSKPKKKANVNTAPPSEMVTRTASARGRDIHLFVNYFVSPNAERAAENRLCLDRNVELGAFRTVHLLVDGTFDQASLAHLPDVEFHVLPGRPTFADFFALAVPDAINVVANTDIEFTPSIQLTRHFDWDSTPRTVMCVSRTDRVKGDSQDAWIFHGAMHIAGADFYLGKMACDGVIANRFVAHPAVDPPSCEPVPHLRALRPRARKKHPGAAMRTQLYVICWIKRFHVVAFQPIWCAARSNGSMPHSWKISVMDIHRSPMKRTSASVHVNRNARIVCPSTRNPIML